MHMFGMTVISIFCFRKKRKKGPEVAFTNEREVIETLLVMHQSIAARGKAARMTAEKNLILLSIVTIVTKGRRM